MKTFNNIGLAVILSLVLSSCVKETFVLSSRESAAITFMPATYCPATKVSGSVFPTAQSFGTFAFASPDGTDWGNYPYMNNQEIHFSGGLWVPTVDYYWPKINKVSFLSYAPYSATPWVTSATARSLLAENKTPGPDDDWMYADIAADYNEYLKVVKGGGSPTDEVTDDNTPSESGFSGIPTLFRHALARVAFNIKASMTSMGSSGLIVNAEDEKIESSSSTEWVKDDVASTSYIEGDNGTDAVRTVVDVYHKTETLNMSQTTVTTEIDTPGGWTITVSSISFVDIINNGTMELEAASGHVFGTAEMVGMTGGWRLADGQDYASIVLPNALGNNPLTTTFQPLLAERSVIPQALDRLSLSISYTSTINATHATVTTSVVTWDRIKEYTQTHVVKTNILNGKIVSDDTDETFVVTDGAKTQVDNVEVSNNEDITVSYEKLIGLYGQGGLTEWPMNRRIIYNIIIEPSGKRITWDPAQVTAWTSDSGSIVIE